MFLNQKKINNQNQEVKRYGYFKEGSDSCNMRIVGK